VSINQSIVGNLTGSGLATTRSKLNWNVIRNVVLTRIVKVGRRLYLYVTPGSACQPVLPCFDYRLARGATMTESVVCRIRRGEEPGGPGSLTTCPRF